MRLQLVFVVESDSRSKTDWIYIKESLARFYDIHRTDIKLSILYMGGKGNYSKKDKDISKLKKQYADLSSAPCKTVVLYCFDTDDYEKNPEAEEFIRKVKAYCNEHDYELVWFCHDIEEVFYGKSVPDDLKTKLANDFKIKHLVNTVKRDRLCNKSFKSSSSNLLLILDKYLK